MRIWTLSILFFPLLSFAALKNGFYISSCHRDDNDYSKTINAYVRIQDDNYYFVARYYSDKACQHLYSVSDEEGLFSDDSIDAGSVRALTFQFARDTKMTPDQLAETGGPLYFRVLSPATTMTPRLASESIAIEKPFFYEAYGRATVLNSISEMHFPLPILLQFRNMTFNLHRE